MSVPDTRYDFEDVRGKGIDRLLLSDMLNLVRLSQEQIFASPFGRGFGRGEIGRGKERKTQQVQPNPFPVSPVGVQPNPYK